MKSALGRCTRLCTISLLLHTLGSTSQLKRNGKPELFDLDRIDYNGKTIQVIASSAFKWERIAMRLRFEGEIESVDRDNRKVEDACRSVFSTWLEGKEGLREPITWATVVAVLKEVGLGVLSDDLNSVLS